ncbi:MAG: serine/threonine protein kinase [Pyrobaculum sp.]
MDTVAILAATLGGGLRHAVDVYRQLRLLGLRIIPGGGVVHGGVYVVGKGTNSVVFKCVPEVGEVVLACKIRRGDSTRPSLIHEAQFLRLANAVGVGPGLYAYSSDVVAYRYVDGVSITQWWKNAKPREKAALITELLSQAYALDKAGISHNELARLERHVLVEGGRPVVIDFESASLGGRRNVTQAVNGLMRLGLRPPVDALRRYKQDPSESNLREIIQMLLAQL